MTEITTLTVNGETYALTDSAAREAIGQIGAVLDEINGEVV